MSVTFDPGRAHRPRDGYLVRIRVRARRVALDRRLATGVEPSIENDLMRRADQLTEARTRRRIAGVLDRILDEAAGPPPPFSAKAPLARTAIVACAPRICEIAGRLAGDQAVAARGVAQAEMLIHEVDSPLFSTSTTDMALNARLAEIILALGAA